MEQVVLDKKLPEGIEIKDGDTVVRLSDIVSKNFVPFWKDNSYNKILKGGRSSTKSSNISLRMVKEFLEDDMANAVCFRKVAKYLSTSVYEQIKWAIYMLKAENEFTFYKSPMKIEHHTGSAFYFFGVDDPMKIKSAKIAVGYVKDLWFEEAAEFDGKEEIDLVADTFIREKLPDGKHVNVYFSYNPPRNPYVWINEWVDELESDTNYYIHHSTYEEVQHLLSKQMLDKILKVKITDPDYHDWMYGGKIIGFGNNVYNFKLFNIIDELPDDDRLILADIAIDTGYSTSATTFLYVGLTVKQRVILLDTYYYSPVNKVNKKAPSDFSKDLHDFTQRNVKQWGIHLDTQTVDSADGAIRNQYAKDHGIFLTPARKKDKEKMIENVEDLLALGRMYVLNTENNKIFLDEHRKYQWDEESLKTPQPKVVKVDDHTCDAFQYYVNNNLSKLNLKM
jgi:phage terminase large subunit